MGAGPSTARDHLFISYATEDLPLAAWLTRRLTAEGYQVWCDRVKLLGGESYPKDIDKAIGERTFRFLPLLSNFSKAKDNPVKERTKAIKVGQALQIADFIIPLNVDGITDLDWMMTDLTYIPFHLGWATGFRQLLDKLDSIHAPRPLDNGRQIAIESFLPDNVISASPETVFSNCLPFTNIPSTILRFTVDPPLVPEERRPVAVEWPHYFVSPRELLALQPPRPPLLEGRVTLADRFACVDVLDIGGIRTGDLLASLLFKAVRHRAAARGLLQSFDHRLYYYFPSGLCRDDKVVFKTAEGAQTWVRVTGERVFWRLGASEKYRYHLGAAFRVRRDVRSGYVLQLTPVFHITDPVGQPLPSRTVASRRKRLAKNWWNYEWLNRHLAVASFLAGGEDPMILLGDSTDPLQLSSRFFHLDAPFGINEASLGITESDSTVENRKPDGDDTDDGPDDESEDDA